MDYTPYDHRPSTESLLATQATSTAVWLAAVRTLRATLDGLDFPCGSPVVGADIEDIRATLIEYEDQHDALTLAWTARDRVSEWEFSAGATAVDARGMV